MTQDDTASDPASTQPGQPQPASGQAVGAWLEELGSAAPAPGGGAAAAMSAGIAAALVEMVCNLTIGRPKFAGHEPLIMAVRDHARELRARALSQIDADADAFTGLMAAYRRPRDSDEEKAARRSAVQAATRRAAAVPLEVAATAAEVVGLAAQLPGRSNPAVLSDVGVAASSAAAAIDSAAINVEVNLATLADAGARTELAGELARHLAVAGQARDLVASVRREISQ